MNDINFKIKPLFVRQYVCVCARKRFVEILLNVYNSTKHVLMYHSDLNRFTDICSGG